MTKVFISYSHDSDEHRKRVLELSNRLRGDGIDCDIDQYDPMPNEGWPLWMLRHMQDANYVLLVCTETYQKRVEQREEKGKGLGVKWEGMMLLNQLYRNESLNTKFIPVIFEPEDEAFIPDPVFGFSRYDLSKPRGYDHLYRHIRGELGAEKPPLGKPHYTRTIYSNSLPTVEGKLFGRKDELALLDKAWSDPQTHVVQFVASGGTGKTKLLKHWLDTNTDKIEALIAWSFYSQGSSEDKQVSATPFFSHVFRVLKSEKTQFNTEEEKGEHLAHLLRQRRCLLVLDGLEPLQHAGKGMRGELKDRAIRQLLRSLVGEHNSLCIITTRLAVHELSDRAHVISHDLQNLRVEDGVSLLKSWEVHGSEIELEKAVHEYGCHALALHLLGNALHTHLDGDVRKRDTLDELLGDYDAIERHAFKVMQAYSRWLEGTPELQLLHLLGLFDHPIEIDVLQVLWQAQIPNFTAGIPEKAWKVAIRDLREKHWMLSAHEGRPDLLDCHPLIREYFGQQLQHQQPTAWQQAHETLYNYYKALPEKELPDTLEEMQPLFSAAAHGCAAGLHQQVISDVYWPRIRRKDSHYLLFNLGSFSDDVAIVSNFFNKPWSHLSSHMTDKLNAVLLNWTGFSLRALGRLQEAEILLKKSINLFTKLKDFKNSALNLSNLSEVQLTLGKVLDAMASAENSVEYADKSNDINEPFLRRTAYADALHQYGDLEKSKSFFHLAEEMARKNAHLSFCQYDFLSSLEGFQYCDLLLEYDDNDVLVRAVYGVDKAESKSLLNVALYQLVLGRAFMSLRRESSFNILSGAIERLRNSGRIDYIPLGLLARATLYRVTGDFARARADLQEVFDIAEPSGMRLHLTDYHLEMVRLVLAEGQNRGDVSYHITAAAKLIQETGYHRRDKELLELQQAVATHHEP